MLHTVSHLPRRQRGMLALAVILALSTGAMTAGATGLAAASDDVPSAEIALARAKDVRVGAEQRLSSLQAERDHVRAELQRLDSGTAEITVDLADARRAVREYAVAAYIDGGQSQLLASSMSPEQSASLAWRSQLVAGQTVSASEAIDRFSALERANDPDRVAAAAQLDRVNSEIELTFNDAVQSSALERDAEHALADARTRRTAAAEQTASADRSALQKAALQKAALQKAALQKAAGRATPAATAAGGAPGAIRTTGSEAALLARIRRCESHGVYTVVSSSGRYRGAYQFDTRTWQSVGGSGDPAAASPAEQDGRALLLLRQRGNNPWPNCG